MKRLSLIALLLIAAAIPTPAQDTDCFCTVDLVGNVRNQEGRRISNAIVSLSGCKDLACTAWETRTTRTNTFGYFTFRDNLLIDYVIEIEARGYQPYAAIIPMYEVVGPYTEFILMRPGQSQLKDAAASIDSDTPREPSRSIFLP